MATCIVCNTHLKSVNIFFEQSTGGFLRIGRKEAPVRWHTGLMAAALFLISMKPGIEPTENRSVIQYKWRVVRVFPHDTNAFTQGLIFRDGYLYESTGRWGESELRKVHLQTGKIIQRRQLENEYFGEGLTGWKNRLIQLTLDSGTGFIYDIQSFERIRKFPIEGEGWGLTTDGDYLIMSDGSSFLRFLDPETFAGKYSLQVTENGEPVPKLNELEMIEGKIFANVLFRNEILIINPENGKVEGVINLQKLVKTVRLEHSANILNGIAYDASTGRIYVTGKLWPNVFEIEIRKDRDG